MVNEDFYLQEPDDKDYCETCNEQHPCGNGCDNL